MALGPEKIHHALSLEQLERQIDAAIQKSSSTSVTIDSKFLPATEKQKEEIVRMYKAAGWTNVKWVFDQRDGDYLHLYM